MKREFYWAALLACVMGLSVAARAFNYIYLTEYEMTPFGDRFRLPLDTLDGPVRSNDQLGCFHGTVFTDLFVTSADTGCGNAEFLGPPPIYNATEIEIPDRAEFIRAMAVTQSNLFGDPDTMIMLNLRDTIAVLWSWPLGVPMDSSDSRTLSIPQYEQVFWFFESPIRIRGMVTGNLVIGCSNSIGIEDNVLYADADSRTGITPLSSTNFLTLAAEGEIKIRNTPENGRENSDGMGHGQINPDLRDVVITANLFALGESFTFENQNDPDSGYVCDCAPDERGFLHIYGGLTQRRRGHVHRSTLGGTGYQMILRHDTRIRDQQNLVVDAPSLQRYPDTLDFGDATVNETVWDTLEITSDYSISVYGAFATPPFFASGATPPVYGDTVRVPVSFTAAQPRDYNGILTVYADFGSPVITLIGRGVPRLASEISAITSNFGLSVYPNPFNAMAEVRIALPEHEIARLVVYDRLGRVVRDFGDVRSSAVTVDGTMWGSGLYFVRAEGAHTNLVTKMLLLK